jgi:tRNA dimethylallyltransferase
MRISIVVIVGPTAIGKSDYAVKYALKHNGEVISADSRQIYKGLDLGTGKITKKKMRGVPHHLLDIANPKRQFNVEKYKKLAQKAILDIHNRGKLPIICGGTGFYIDAVIDNITYPDVEHNIKLRNILIKKDAQKLFKILEKLDTRYAISLNNSERNNKVRLVRAIEIAKELGRVPKIKKDRNLYKVKWIKLELPIEKLEKRINQRLVKRINNGMIKEVKSLHKNGLSWKRMEELGLEYRYISRYLRGSISKEEMIKQLQLEIRRYAKRQILWFRKGK